MKNKPVLILILVALVGIGLFYLPKFFNQGKKNVIIISLDGLQAKHLHSYGYPLETTPNLDSFINRSTLFTNTVSPASWTVPAHMSIFTSMYPSEHKIVNKFSDYDLKTQKGVLSNLKKLTPDAVTLAEILKKEGYVTGGFTGDAGVGPQFGFGQGFDTYYETETFGGLNGSVPKALDWLKLNKDKPFYLFLHGYDVHGQHELEGGSKGTYVSKDYKGIFTGSKKEQGILREEGLTKGSLNMSEEDVAFWRAIYDEKINRMDLEFKKIMDQLKELGVMDNTIIIVMSDHGTEFYEHKRFDHGFSLYGEVIDTLLAIHEPNQNKGQKIDQLVSTLDILPTVLALLNIKNPVPAQVKGVNLKPALSGQKVAHNVFSETDYRLYTFKRSINTPDGWKLILTLENGNRELFDLNNDPTEQTNLITENPQKGYELELVLQKHMEDISGQRTAGQLGCSPVYGDQCRN